VLVPKKEVARANAAPQVEKPGAMAKQQEAATFNPVWERLALGMQGESGQPLDPNTLQFFEPRFGRDLGEVRLHTGRAAETSARAVDARAYTLGRDIVFGAGEYRPHTPAGQRLLAHELTHVVQQQAGGATQHAKRRQRLQRQPRDLPATAAAGNALFFPESRPSPPAQIRVDTLAHLQGGLVTDTSLRARASAIIGPGATLRGIAARMVSVFAAATAPTSVPGASTPPTADELAKGLLVYSRYYLPVPSMAQYKVGLRLPLPIEIDQNNGDWIVNPNMIRLWAGSFEPAWTPLLDQAPAALSAPTSADLDADATAFLAANTTPLAQGIALGARIVSNPFQEVGLVTRLFQRLGAGAFDVALQLMNFSVRHQMELLATLIPGDAILRQLRIVLSAPPVNLSQSVEADRQRALRMLPVTTGWAPPIRADELGTGGADRLADRTFDCNTFSVFIPSGAIASSTNKVHVFYSPGGVTTVSGGNAVAVHGLRGAAEASDWIVISVPGAPGRAFTISDAQIIHCLQLVGRPAQIDLVRLSAHSRGNGGMAATLQRRLITPSLIDHVTILDATDFSSSLTAGLNASHVPASKVTAYDVNTGTFGLPGVQNLQINSACIRSIGYARLINDAVASGRASSVPPAIATRVAALNLPPRGSFTTASPPPAGKTNIGTFCSNPANAAALTNMRDGEATVANPGQLAGSATTSPYAFIEFNNLMNFNDPNQPRSSWISFPPGIYSHHLFVAEIAWELFP